MKKVVYGHYNLEGRLFYVGTGNISRAYSKHSRNKIWKELSKGGTEFSVEIFYKDLEEDVAKYIEKRLIQELSKNPEISLCNFCIGDIHESHWLKGAPKDRHPMYGKKRPDSSKRLSEWNRGRSGKLSPTYGIKREDLAKLNKSRAKKIKLLELDLVFDNCEDLKDYLGVHYFRYSVVNKPNKTFKGFHFEYV